MTLGDVLNLKGGIPAESDVKRAKQRKEAKK
jgi:hypothetical protein